MCEPQVNQAEEFFKIGAMKKVNCTVDLKALTSNATLPRYANLFYDLFMEDFDGSLIDVPIYNLQA